MAIDIGADAINRGSTFSSNTLIALDNPIDVKGYINEIELYAAVVLYNCKVGGFSRDGDNFTCRDYETIGSVSSGSKQTFSVDIHCEIGDYIGIYFSSGLIERDLTGYAGVYAKTGDQFEAGSKHILLTRIIL